MARVAKPEPLISREMTVGVKERVNSRGEIVRPLDEEDFLEKLQCMVDKGARGFVVSLLFSYINPGALSILKVEFEIGPQKPGQRLSCFISRELNPENQI